MRETDALRRISRFACRAAAALAVVGLICADTARAGRVERRDDGTTVIHLMLQQLPDPASVDTAARADIAAINEFKRRFPTIFAAKYRDKYKADPARYGAFDWDKVEIQLKRFSGIQVENVETDLLAIAGGLAPDLLYVNFRKSDNWIQSRFLYPLDKPEDGYLTSMTQEEIDFRIHPKIWPVIRRKGPDGVKRVWAIPYGGALGKVLLYRKDLFDENNIAYPTKDWTWDDLLAAAKKLTDPSRNIYGILFGRGKHESWYWVTFLWSAGGEVMTYNEETDQWRCAFDSRGAAKALDFYVRLSAEKWTDKTGQARRGYAHKDPSEGGVKWLRGEIGMRFSYIDEKLFATINPELTGMAPVPLGPPLVEGDESSRMRGAELNSRMMGLFSDIKHPAVRDAAWEYLRFFDSKEAVRIKTRIMVEGGLGPFINPKYLRMFGYPEVERLAPKGWAETFEIAISTGKPEPYGRNSNLAYTLMTYPIVEAEQLALNDKLPADDEQRLNLLHDMLKKANARANEEMIGIISPRERFWRDAAAWVVLAGIVVAFTFVFRKIIRAFTPPKMEGIEREQLSWGFRRYAWAYVLLIPAVGTILVWRYAPLLWGSTMAFQDYQLLGESKWVWVRNFGDLLWDNAWWRALYDTVRYSFLVMSLTFLPPIILAILLQEVPRGRLLFRTIYYLPRAVAGLVIMLLWKQFYEPSKSGVLNSIVMRIPAVAFVGLGACLLAVAVVFARRMLYHDMRLGAWIFILAGIILLATCSSLAGPILRPLKGEAFIETVKHFPIRLFRSTPEPYRWLADSKTAMFAIVIPMVWASVGPGCLIYLAALKGIADDYYEAADVDGATFIDKILFVVFPILKPLILINFIGVFIASFYGAAGNILAMTGGAANTEIASLHIFFKAFTLLKFGPATAMAWVLAFMLIGFTVHQLQILSRLEFRTTGDKK